MLRLVQKRRRGYRLVGNLVASRPFSSSHGTDRGREEEGSDCKARAGFSSKWPPAPKCHDDPEAWKVKGGQNGVPPIGLLCMTWLMAVRTSF